MTKNKLPGYKTIAVIKCRSEEDRDDIGQTLRNSNYITKYPTKTKIIVIR